MKGDVCSCIRIQNYQIVFLVRVGEIRPTIFIVDSEPFIIHDSKIFFRNLYDFPVNFNYVNRNLTIILKKPLWG